MQFTGGRGAILFTGKIINHNSQGHYGTYNRMYLTVWYWSYKIRLTFSPSMSQPTWPCNHFSLVVRIICTVASKSLRYSTSVANPKQKVDPTQRSDFFYLKLAEGAVPLKGSKLLSLFWTEEAGIFLRSS
jgi:hypothetical protein